jgi:hypothetical protein
MLILGRYNEVRGVTLTWPRRSDGGTDDSQDHGDQAER